MLTRYCRLYGKVAEMEKETGQDRKINFQVKVKIKDDKINS